MGTCIILIESQSYEGTYLVTRKTSSYGGNVRFLFFFVERVVTIFVQMDSTKYFLLFVVCPVEERHDIHLSLSSSRGTSVRPISLYISTHSCF